MSFVQILINFIAGFVLVMAVMPKSIEYFKKLKFGQVEREEGLESHKQKGGTPTMGGIVFILCSVLVVYILNFSYFQKSIYSFDYICICRIWTCWIYR